MPIAVRLSGDLEKRLSFLSQETGRKKSFYVKEALGKYLDDMEDVYLAEKVIEQIRSGAEEVLDSERFWNEMAD